MPIYPDREPFPRLGMHSRILESKTMINGKILIVGGYGSVGRVIATTLGKRFPGRVVAAGRNYHKAKQLSSETQQQVLPLALDIYKLRESELRDVAVVVTCIDQGDTQFVEQCLRRGIHYVDISASYKFLSKIEALDSEARKHGSTVVLSVGLAPGLTNLLVSYCQSVFEALEQVDIFIMLGSGEVPGKESILWILENLDTEFLVREKGVLKQVRSFEDSKETVFPDEFGRRRAYRFNFSDRHAIAKTFGIDSISTWVCFDLALVTQLFALSTKIGLSKALRSGILKNLLVKIFQTFQFGSDKFEIEVDARGIVDGNFARYEPSIRGQKEGMITGLVAAKVAEHLYTSSLPSGVFHIEQLFDPLEFIESLNGNGLIFSRSELKPESAGSTTI